MLHIGWRRDGDKHSSFFYLHLVHMDAGKHRAHPTPTKTEAHTGRKARVCHTRPLVCHIRPIFQFGLWWLMCIL